MRTVKSVLLLFLCGVVAAHAQTSDYPGASDLPGITRPANSFIIGAMHIDNDEFQVPVGPVDRNSERLGIVITATGPIDTIAYAGPVTVSSFANYNALKAQAMAAGYTEIWSCARTTCGSAFALARILDKALEATIVPSGRAIDLNNELNATNDDIRYGAFRRGDVFLLIMASLQPGRPSGSLIIRVNGPVNESALQTATAESKDPQNPAATQQKAPAPSFRDRIRNAANAIRQTSPQ